MEVAVFWFCGGSRDERDGVMSFSTKAVKAAGAGVNVKVEAMLGFLGVTGIDWSGFLIKVYVVRITVPHRILQSLAS